MCHTLQVRWTITPRIAPQPWIACSRCGGLRAFQSSDKVRLNANGRKLDAWLIYKCIACEKTWNRPIFERRNVRDIAPAVLAALQANDPDWILAETFNVDALRRKAQRVDEFAEYDVQKQVQCDAAGWTRLEIELAVPLPISMRLDRLLASELGLSRAQLSTLHANARLRTNPERADVLRRRIKHGLRITLDRADVAERQLIVAR